MSAFSVSLPPPRLHPAASLQPAASPAAAASAAASGTPSNTAAASQRARPADGAQDPTRTSLHDPLRDPLRDPDTDRPRARPGDRVRDPALAGPPPAFQTNLLDQRYDLETLVRDMDAARAAEARILYGSPPRPPGPASAET